MPNLTKKVSWRDLLTPEQESGLIALIRSYDRKEAKVELLTSVDKGNRMFVPHELQKPPFTITERKQWKFFGHLDDIIRKFFK